ncbi:hypothetical protein GWR56_08035 [Mucilaginibacter sp. 14171R-50]|uniref:hypothetical protein n=1 Tax=Mucilaginibacter sp. 14171R-50 TaxID=2703789 RepID=UPI00138D1022|nr:hypothetical protein [Mucilaginibacter sp. 14171R-50]QHS55490.1 hypothetical protein GWR56_08035 [Mucilaginibacter sp. 14171R-50]
MKRPLKIGAFFCLNNLHCFVRGNNELVWSLVLARNDSDAAIFDMLVAEGIARLRLQ